MYFEKYYYDLKTGLTLSSYYVDFFLVSNQIGLCASYVVFIASAIHKVSEP